MENVRKRYCFFDELKGFFIILVVLFHTIYDLAFIFPTEIGYTLFEFFEKFVIPGASPFIFICGVSCFFSRSNLKRGLILVGIALAITIGTLKFMPDEPIYFGILHCLGFSILLFIPLKKLILKINWIAGLISSLFLFALTYNVQYGYLGFGKYSVMLSPKLCELKYLLPFGFFPSSFVSADYFPLIPFFFLFLGGCFIGKIVTEKKDIPFLEKNHIPPLSFLGRHTLIVYIVHQPIVLGILWSIFKVFKIG